MNHNQTNKITREISSQRKLETLLYDVMKIAVAQGLKFEPGLIKARSSRCLLRSGVRLRPHLRRR